MLVQNGNDAYVETGVRRQFLFPGSNRLADVADIGNTGGFKFILFSATLRLVIDWVDKP